jgi:hypothetical protein
MADNRSTRLRQRCQDFLGDSEGDALAKAKSVYNALNRAQVRACEEANAYETSGSINIVAGTEQYAFPDGFIGEIAVLQGTHAPLVGSGLLLSGTVNGIREVLIQSTNTAFTWDVAFTRTYTDLQGATVPLYRFDVEFARIVGSFIDESIILVSKSLTGMTLRSSSDATVVRFLAEE